MAQRPDIERLIAEGLDCYAAGDLDHALLLWEQALALDRDNPAAKSYVDYVRRNYELLREGEPRVEEADVPFGIEEEPEYQIEIEMGELPAGEASPEYMNPLDQGWFIDDELPAAAATIATPREASDVMTFELDAEEPPREGLSFEDATREYMGTQARVPTSDFAMPEGPTTEFRHEDSSGGFKPEATPTDFAHVSTDVRQRDLGFVKPAPAVPAEPAERPPGLRHTLDMPVTRRAPARDTRSPVRDSSAVSQAEVVLTSAPTRDLERGATQRDQPLITAPTRELGLRRQDVEVDEDAHTQKADIRTLRDHAELARSTPRDDEGTRHDLVLPFDPIAARSAQILDEVDVGAPESEAEDDRTRRRITALFDRALAWNSAGELDKAVTAVDLALSEAPNSALAQKLIHRNRDAMMTVFQNFIGDLERQPQLARPLHELASAPISPRAAFLLSRVDGMLSVDELLDVSGMPRLEAYRHLCQLFLRGVLR